MAHQQILVMLVHKKTKKQNKSITVPIQPPTHLIPCINSLHITTIEKLKRFRFTKDKTQGHTTNEDLQFQQVHTKEEKKDSTGNLPKPYSGKYGVTLSIRGVKVMDLKPPKKITQKPKPNKKTTKIPKSTKIANQPTLTMLLQKTGVELGKNWVTKISKNERPRSTAQKPVYDRYDSDDARLQRGKSTEKERHTHKTKDQDRK